MCMYKALQLMLAIGNGQRRSIAEHDLILVLTQPFSGEQEGGGEGEE